MENSRFDRLARTVSEASSRRGLLRVLAMLPLLGLSGSVFDAQDAEAGRRRRRKARHRRRKKDRRRDRKEKRRRKRKQRSCKPESTARTCEGRCGTVRNNCKKTVNCDPCVCEPGCEFCETCDTTIGQCKPDPEQLGVVCGEENQVCRDDGTCGTCDVCSDGCQYSSVQDAIDAANTGEVIHICEGDYNGTLTINKSVILVGVGSGDGEGNTTLNGNEDGSVVTVSANITVTLQTLRIASGVNENGGGISNQGFLALNGCTVTGCRADQGGGIDNRGSLILNQSSIEDNLAAVNEGEGGGIFNGAGGHLEMNRSQISGNTAGRAGGGLFNDGATATLNFSTISGNTATGLDGTEGLGGGIYNELGTVTLNPGSSVTGNNPDNCAGEAVAGCSG